MNENGGAETVTEKTEWSRTQNRDKTADQRVNKGPIKTAGGHRRTYRYK